MRFRITSALADEQLDFIDNSAFKILENVGMAISHPEILEMLKGAAGVHVNGEIVRFEKAVVKHHIENVKGCEEYDTHLITGGYSHILLDSATNETRSPNTEDLIRTVCQADALGLAVCAPVVPMDVPGPKQELIMERLTHENARVSYGAGQATNPITAEACLEMSEVVGRPHGLELWITSPLKIDRNGLDIILRLRHKKPKIRVANMPGRGMTAPVALSGLLAQSAAECFGAVTMLRLLAITGPVSYRIDAFWSYAVDMRSGNILLSGPDYFKLMLLSIFLAKRHGISVPAAKAFLTSAKEVGVQATVEKTAQGIAASMAGADVFMGAGMLSSAEIFSPLQMVIDREILRFIDAATGNVDFSEDSFSLEDIKDVAPGGNFFGHESTVRRFRECTWNSDLFSVNPLSAWINEGKPSFVEKAKDILHSLQYHPGSAVTPEVHRELVKIENKFAALL
ncbi:MAG: trimethylamine methyltransferase family protein [Candidatus Omnitrophota bacterium]